MLLFIKMYFKGGGGGRVYLSFGGIRYALIDRPLIFTADWLYPHFFSARPTAWTTRESGFVTNDSATLVVVMGVRGTPVTQSDARP